MKKNSKKPVAQTIDQRMAAREKELNATFHEICKAIDDYMHAAPVVLIEGSDAAPGDYIFPNGNWREGGFNKFQIWIENWMGVLYPRTLDYQQKIKDGKAGDDEYMELCFDGKRFGYMLGYLVGCRAMGANFEDLLEKSKGFTRNDVGWRTWMAESEQAKT